MPPHNFRAASRTAQARAMPREDEVTKPKTAEVKEADDVKVGDQVRHSKWGTGTVLFKSGSEETTKVIVVFPEEGQKKLMLRYAKLKKVGTLSKSEMAARVKAAAGSTADKVKAGGAAAAAGTSDGAEIDLSKGAKEKPATGKKKAKASRG